jgi:hypothetical protein
MLDHEMIPPGGAASTEGHARLVTERAPGPTATTEPKVCEGADLRPESGDPNQSTRMFRGRSDWTLAWVMAAVAFAVHAGAMSVFVEGAAPDTS